MTALWQFLRFRHRWVRDDGKVVGRLPWHSLTPDDVGHRLRVVVVERGWWHRLSRWYT